MADQAVADHLTSLVDADDLARFLPHQRWYGARSRDILDVEVVDAVGVGSAAAVVVLDVHFDGGTHDHYQLLLAPAPEPGGDDTVGRALEAAGDEGTVNRIVDAVRDQATLPSSLGALEFRRIRPPGDERRRPVRVISGEQSNTSVVVDDLVLKMYRRVEAGINPELEMLLFLTEHEFPHVPELVGWYRYVGPALTTTLGIVQRFLPAARDGWELALESGTGDAAAAFLDHVEHLGDVVGRMHCVLASEPDDPSFAPEEATPETSALIVARVEEQVDTLFADLPAGDLVEPLRGRGDDARSRLRAINLIDAPGRAIRLHGDLHLGQALWSGDEWAVIDFEGEPTRPVVERRAKAHPLRDVAGMLRSFSYAASVLEQGDTPPVDDWEGTARASFLRGYRSALGNSSLVPGDVETQDRYLELFELERAVYELRYDLEHRPDWAVVPVRAIQRMLDAEP